MIFRTSVGKVTLVAQDPEGGDVGAAVGDAVGAAVGGVNIIVNIKNFKS